MIKSLSIALGVFIGIAPFWGFQTVLVLFLAVLFRWNKLLAFTFSNISFPPMIPFIIFASLQMGSFFVNENVILVSNQEFTFETIKNHTFQYIVGSFIFASITAFVFGLGSFFILSFSKKSKK